MALSDRLALLITANVDDAVRGFKKVGSAAEKELGAAEKRIDRLGNNMSVAGAGMAAFGAVALVGLGAAARASEEANLSQVKLQNTLNNMPKLAGESVDSFNDLADAIQDKTAADGDQVTSAMAMLGTFNLTGDEIRRITPLVVDYARKFGVDLVTAAASVGKALDGSIGALKRNGVSIDETIYKTDRYRAVQEALADQVGGFAEAEGATFAGSLERMKNQLGDVTEGVGSGAVDAFTNMFDAVGSATSAMDAFSPSAQNTAGEIATYGSVALIAVGATSTLVGQVILARERFSQAADAVRGFTEASGGLKSALGKAGITGAITVAAFALNKFATSKITERLREMPDDIDAVTAALRELGATGSTSLIDIDKLGGAFDKLDSTVLRIGSNPIFSGGLLSDAAKGELDAAKQDIDAVDKALAHLAESGNTDEAKEAFDRLTASLIAQGVPVDKIKSAFDDYNAALNVGAANAAADGVKDVGDAAEQSAPKVRTLADDLNDFNTEIDKFLGKVFSVEDANDEFQGSINAVAGAVKEAGGAFTGTSDAAIGFRDSQQAIVENAGGVLSAMAEQGASASHVKQRQAELADQYLRTAAANGVPLSVAQRYADAIRSIPTSAYTYFALDSADAEAALARLNRAFGALEGRHQAAVVAANFTPGQRRAAGGPVNKGQPYIVGEKRAEVFVPETNGRILPRVSGSGIGGGNVTYVTNHISVTNPDPKAVVRELERYERSMAGATAEP